MSIVKCKPWAKDKSQGDFVLVDTADWNPDVHQLLPGQPVPSELRQGAPAAPAWGAPLAAGAPAPAGSPAAPAPK